MGETIPEEVFRSDCVQRLNLYADAAQTHYLFRQVGTDEYCTASHLRFDSHDAAASFYERDLSFSEEFASSRQIHLPGKPAFNFTLPFEPLRGYAMWTENEGYCRGKWFENDRAITLVAHQSGDSDLDLYEHLRQTLAEYCKEH